MAPKVAIASPPPTAAAPAASAGFGWRQRSAQFFCLLMVFGFPIFSVPCQKGICSSPLEVVATQGYSKNLLSEQSTKYLMYPATLMLKMEVLMGDEPQSFRLPEWDSILTTWNISSSLIEDDQTPNSKKTGFRFFPNLLTMFEPQNPQILSWEFVGACALCLVAGVVSLAGPNKMGFWGMLLILWFLFIEGGKRKDVTPQPMLVLGLICSLGWVKLKDLFFISQREELSATQNADSKVEEKKTE